MQAASKEFFAPSPALVENGYEKTKIFITPIYYIHI